MTQIQTQIQTQSCLCHGVMQGCKGWFRIGAARHTQADYQDTQYRVCVSCMELKVSLFAVERNFDNLMMMRRFNVLFKECEVKVKARQLSGAACLLRLIEEFKLLWQIKDTRMKCSQKWKTKISECVACSLDPVI